jgi:hypothetical protein
MIVVGILIADHIKTRAKTSRQAICEVRSSLWWLVRADSIGMMFPESEVCCSLSKELMIQVDRLVLDFAADCLIFSCSVCMLYLWFLTPLIRYIPLVGILS